MLRPRVVSMMVQHILFSFAIWTVFEYLGIQNVHTLKMRSASLIESPRYALMSVSPALRNVHRTQSHNSRLKYWSS